MNFRREIVTLAVVLGLLGVSTNAFNYKNLKVPGFTSTTYKKVKGRPVPHETPDLPEGKYDCLIDPHMASQPNIFWLWTLFLYFIKVPLP
jgi:hypothetical protein